MDALPVTLGDEFAAYAVAISKSNEALKRASTGLYTVALGGTAVGSGANTPKRYRKIVVSELAKISKLPIKPEPNMHHGLQSRFAIVSVSSALKNMAIEIAKIANDIRLMASGPWLKGELKGTELKGKYLGIVGLGNIGKRLARLARALNMNIIGYDPAAIDGEFSKEVGLFKADLETLLKSSDYVSLHVPLLESTKHMINAEKLALMKPTAAIINTSRGGVIDEDALYDALVAGKLGGAALDVFEVEPATENKLTELDSVVLTPHIGAMTAEAQSLAANIIGEKIVQILRGIV